MFVLEYFAKISERCVAKPESCKLSTVSMQWQNSYAVNVGETDETPIPAPSALTGLHTCLKRFSLQLAVGVPGVGKVCVV